LNESASTSTENKEAEDVEEPDSNNKGSVTNYAESATNKAK
jgi:hypothetical protein